MVTGKILTITQAYPSVQVEVAFTDDQNRLPDPTHLSYNIPVDQQDQLTEAALNSRVQADAANFEAMLDAIVTLTPCVNTSVTSSGTVTQ